MLLVNGYLTIKKKNNNFEKKIAKYQEIITIGNNTYELTTIIKKIGTVYIIYIYI